MKRFSVVTALVAIGSLILVSPIVARVFPGGGGGSGGGGRISNPAAAAAVANRIQNPKYGNYDGWGGGGPVYVYNNTMTGNMPLQQPSQQSMMIQSGIRDTLLTQAQRNTQAIANQRQDYRDWWYQTEQRQSAERRAGSTGASALLGQSCGFEPVEAPPKVAMDVIKWPTLLQKQAFASRRSLVEAPYRRTPPKLSTPTAKDYGEMVATIQEMKDILEWLTTKSVDTQEYDQAKAFLDLIQRQARVGAEADSKSSTPT